MSEEKRSFTKLKESMTERELKELCKKIAEAYASSEQEFARSYFSNTYKITNSCFYKILEYAIVNSIISEETVNWMEAKAIQNQKAHAEQAGIRSVLHYKEMRKKRYEKAISELSEEEIRNIAKEFAEDTALSKVDIAKKYGFDKVVIDLLLLKAITELIVDDETFAKIRERSLSHSNDKRTKDFFDKLALKRKAKKEATST